MTCRRPGACWPALAMALVSAGLAGHARQQQPTFTAGVDLIRLDVTVVTDAGVPVDSLEAEDFAVRVNGRPAAVRTLRFLNPRPGLLQLPPGASLAASREYSSTEQVESGRVVVIVVDQDSFPAGAARTLLDNARALLAGLGPADRAALVTIPPPGPRVDFTGDTRLVAAALSRITGRSASRLRQYRITFEEALQLERRNNLVTAAVLDRECSFRLRRPSCIEEVESEARLIVLEGRERVQQVLVTLTNVVDSLAGVEGPKTLVLISGGLGFEDSSLSRFKEIARRASEARLQCYIVHAATFAFDVSEAAQSAAHMEGAEQEGLQTITGMTGGVLFKGVGAGKGVFERIERESRGAYVLGVEPPQGTELGDTIQVDVRVTRRGLVVRTPRHLVPPTRARQWATDREAIGYTLRQPRPSTALPLRLATYTVRGSDLHRLRVLVSAEFPEAGIRAVDVAWGLEVLDGERAVADAFAERGEPRGDSTGIVTAIDVPPGTYTLRFAVVDAAGRRGSLEHHLIVGLRDAGAVQASDLIVGAEPGGRFEPQQRVFNPDEGLTAMLELYAEAASILQDAAVEFALLGGDGIARAVTRVPASSTDQERRRVARSTLPVARVAPGAYTAAATVLLSGRVVGRVTRRVVIGGPMGAQ